VIAPLADEPILLTRSLRARGFNEYALRLAVRRQELVRVARGAYTTGSRWRRMSVADRYRLRCTAHGLTARGPVVLSHQSAAAVLGLPLVHADLSQVHYTNESAARTKTAGALRRHAAPLPITHITDLEGLTVTSVARTLADLASSTPPITGVAAIDHALRLRACTREDIHEAAAARRLHHGLRRLRHAVNLATPLAESPGESLSRVRMHELGFPAPVLQQRWTLSSGRTVYTDFWWPQFGLIGEFDGVAKYVRHEYAGASTPAEVVMVEKRREDALRALGPRVARWGWDTANDARALFSHLIASGLPSSLRGERGGESRPWDGNPPRSGRAGFRG
jgi:hypothetical protein